MSAGGSVLASAFYNVSGSTPDERMKNFQTMEKSVPQELKFAKTVLPRSKSPWALLAPDNFDLEKEGVTQE